MSGQKDDGHLGEGRGERIGDGSLEARGREEGRGDIGGASRQGGGEVEMIGEGRKRGRGEGHLGRGPLGATRRQPPTLCWSVLSTRITRSWLARPPAAFEPVLKTCVMQLSTCSMEPEMMYMSCEGGG